MSSSTNQFALLLILFLFLSLAAGCYSTTFTIVNGCSFTVFPAIFHENRTSFPSTTGFALQPGESNVLTMPGSWSGHLWGRTYCSYDSNGKFSCLTGDCASSTIECDGGNASPPATLAEFNLNAKSDEFDFLRISVVNGYNIPMIVEPQVGNGVGDCMPMGCMMHLNKICPPELKVMRGGDCIGCRNACKPFSRHCYSEFFTKACPHANVNATKTFQSVCGSTNYLINFCPISSLDEPRKEKNPKTVVDNSGGTKKKRSTNNNNIPRSKKHNNFNAKKKHNNFQAWLPLVAILSGGVVIGTGISITCYCCNSSPIRRNGRKSVPNNNEAQNLTRTPQHDADTHTTTLLM